MAREENQREQNYSNDRYGKKLNDSIEREASRQEKPQINTRVSEYRTYSQSHVPQETSTSSKREISPLPPAASKPSEGMPSARYERTTTDNTQNNGYEETISSAERQARTLRQQAAQSNSNVELYNQLSQLREEAFSLRQKNRELQGTINSLREENKLLITNADQEIKRMTDYVDEYTQQMDQTIEEEKQALEAQIKAERQKNEELLQKMHREQDEMNDASDQLRREMEAIKGQN